MVLTLVSICRDYVLKLNSQGGVFARLKTTFLSPSLSSDSHVTHQWQTQCRRPFPQAAGIHLRSVHPPPPAAHQNAQRRPHDPQPPGPQGHRPYCHQTGESGGVLTTGKGLVCFRKNSSFPFSSLPSWPFSSSCYIPTSLKSICHLLQMLPLGDGTHITSSGPQGPTRSAECLDMWSSCFTPCSPSTSAFLRLGIVFLILVSNFKI